MGVSPFVNKYCRCIDVDEYRCIYLDVLVRWVLNSVGIVFAGLAEDFACVLFECVGLSVNSSVCVSVCLSPRAHTLSADSNMLYHPHGLSLHHSSSSLIFVLYVITHAN